MDVFKMSEERIYTEPAYADAGNKPNVQFDNKSTQLNLNVATGVQTQHAIRTLNQKRSNNDKKDCFKRKHTDSEGLDSPDSICMSPSSTNKSRNSSTSYYKKKNHEMLDMEKKEERLPETVTLPDRTWFEEATKYKPISTTNKPARRVQSHCDTNKNGENRKPKAKRRRVSDDNELDAWFDYHYEIYCKINNEGRSENYLCSPQRGRVALYTESFISKRYQEGQNTFLVTPQPPFRVYLGVNTGHPVLAGCINISKIRYADLHKYPRMVRNFIILIRTTTESNENNFCILRGLHFCWEIIGSVTKMSETRDPNNIAIQEGANYIRRTSEEEFNSTGTSKWFVITIKNEFQEIRFLTMEANIRYPILMHAINTTRIADKASRECSKNRLHEEGTPPFGVYAKPRAKVDNVIDGPYEMADTLEIDIMHKTLDARNLRGASGYWMITKKTDNMEVIANPSFLVKQRQINRSPKNYEVNKDEQENPDNDDQNVEYQVADDKYLNASLNMEDNSTKSLVMPIEMSDDLNLYQITGTSKEPATEASQTSQNDDSIATHTNHNGRVIILKPDENNTKSVQNELDQETLTYDTSIDDCNMNDNTLQAVRLLQSFVSGPENNRSGAGRATSEIDAVLSDIYEPSHTILYMDCEELSLDFLLNYKMPEVEDIEFVLEDDNFDKITAEIREKYEGPNYSDGTEIIQWYLEVITVKDEGQE